MEVKFYHPEVRNIPLDPIEKLILTILILMRIASVPVAIWLYYRITMLCYVLIKDIIRDGALGAFLTLLTYIMFIPLCIGITAAKIHEKYWGFEQKA